MYTFYEYPKCSTCRKAKAELNQLGLEVESVNIKENPPSAQFLRELLEGADLELKKFFNTSGQSYRSLGLKDKLPTLSQDEAVKLLSSDGMLIKRPILIKDGKVLQVGYRSPYKDYDKIETVAAIVKWYNRAMVMLRSEFNSRWWHL